MQVAWICCEVDPPEGPGLAGAILDVGPGDDAPALIACDWLEERGAMGAFGDYSPPIPLADWSRTLIATRCLACGGRRDGEDEPIGARGYRPRIARGEGPAWWIPRALRPGSSCATCGSPAPRPAPATPAVSK